MELRTKLFNELSGAEVYEIVRARQEIFLLEQNIICRDFDGVDYNALHCFLWEDGRVVAYMRAFMQCGEIHLGRFLTVRHGEGLGRRLMETALPVVKERLGCEKITFHAQKHAEGFYQKLGFVRVSEVFLEEGIEHVEMREAKVN
jgi:ElaA protein